MNHGRGGNAVLEKQPDPLDAHGCAQPVER